MDNQLETSPNFMAPVHLLAAMMEKKSMNCQYMTPCIKVRDTNTAMLAEILTSATLMESGQMASEWSLK